MKKFYMRKITSLTTSLALIFSNFMVGYAAEETEKEIADPVEHHFSQDADYYEKLKQGDGVSIYNPRERSSIKMGQKGSPVKYVGDSKGGYLRFPIKEVKGTGQLAYCIDHEKNAPSSSGITYSRYGKVDDAIAYMIAYEPKTGDSTLDYYIRQGAIHYYLGEAKWIDNASKRLDIRDKIVNLAKEAVKYKNAGGANASISISTSSTSLDFKQNGNYYETPYVTVSYKGDLQNYTVSVSGGPTGVQVIDQNGNASTTLSKTNTKFKLRVPVANVSASYNNIKASIKGNFKVKKAEAYVSSSSSLQRMAILINESANASASLTSKLNGVGNLTVIKKDENGNKLQGAKFKLQQNGKDVSDVKTSDANGVVKFENISLGTYDLIEVSAPQGYVIAKQSQSVNVNSTTTSIDVVNNKIKGSIRVLKVDSRTQEPLAGAVFELKDSTGKTIETLTTGNDGIAVSSVQPYGEYTVVEIKSPEGYLLNSNPQKVSINNNMTSVQVTFTNDKIRGYLAIEKSDSEIPDLKLEGVEFTIYNKAGEIVDRIVTRKDGSAESAPLDYGTYTVKETRVYNGYKLEQNNSFTVDIKEDKKVYKYEVKNDVIKGKIQIIKIDSQKEDSRVEGAGFDIIAENVIGVKPGTVVEHIVTDKDGLATTKDLRYGTYKIIETKTPEGFWDSNAEYFVDVHEDQQVYVRHIKNDPIQAKLRIIKTDGTTKQKLEGVRFKLVNKKTGEDVVFKVIENEEEVEKTVFETDENGEIQLPDYLRFGTYTIVEVEPKEGYILAEPIDITINKETEMEDIEAVGTVTSQWVENQRITGSMELLKIDTETKEPLENVEFKVECIEGFDKGVVYQLISGKDGKALLENLPYGKYTVTEVKQAEGYVLKTESVPFEIKKNGEKVTLTIENQFIKGEIEIIKTDSKTKATLEGAEFTIFNAEGEEVEKLVTDAKGYAKSKKLPFGFYQMKETKAPENYQLSEEVTDINITEHNKVYKYEITNEKIPAKLSKVEVLKVDAKTKKPLKGVQFKLLNNDKKDIGTGVTNENGIIVFDSIPEGTYYLKETKGLEGYIVISELIKVKVGSDGDTVKITVENQPKLAQTGGNFNFDNMIRVGALVALAAIIFLTLDKRENQ